MHALVSGLFTSHNRDVPAGHIEPVGKERDEGIVRGAVHWRCRQANENGSIAHSIDGAAPGAWNDANVKNRELQTTD